MTYLHEAIHFLYFWTFLHHYCVQTVCLIYNKVTVLQLVLTAHQHTESVEIIPEKDKYSYISI